MGRLLTKEYGQEHAPGRVGVDIQVWAKDALAPQESLCQFQDLNPR